MIQDKILDIEQSVIGKSSSPWAKEGNDIIFTYVGMSISCLLYTSPSPRDVEESRMPSSA